MTQITLPNTSKSTSDPNLFSDVYDNDNAITSVVNGNIDNSNMAAGGGVLLSKLETGASAQIIVCNGSGVPSYVAMSGDVTTTNAGVTSIGADKVTTAKILDANVTNAKLAGSITDAKIVNPNNVVYKTIFQAGAFLAAGAVAGTYILNGTRASTSPYPIDNANTPPSFPFFRFTDTDYNLPAGSSLAVKVNLRAEIAINHVGAGVGYTFGLYPITTGGTNNNEIKFTLGTVKAGTTVVVNGPGANNFGTNASADTTFTSADNGYYALGVVTDAALNANSFSHMACKVRVRHA